MSNYEDQNDAVAASSVPSPEPVPVEIPRDEHATMPVDLAPSAKCEIGVIGYRVWTQTKSDMESGTYQFTGQAIQFGNLQVAVVRYGENLEPSPALGVFTDLKTCVDFMATIGARLEPIFGLDLSDCWSEAPINALITPQP